MKKIALAAAVSLLGLATPVLAQDGDFDSREMIPYFSKSNLNTIAAQLDPISTEWRQMGDGEESLILTMPSGIVIIVKPSACNSGRCVGLSLTGLWNKPDGESDAAMHEKLAAFNDTAVPTATLYPTGVIALTDYVIADFGVPQGNIVVTLQVFDSYAQRLSEIVG